MGREESSARAHRLHSSTSERYGSFMKNLAFVLGIALALSGCARNDAYEIPTGSDVTLQKKDGVSVSGKLVEVKAEQVVLESRDGVKMEVPRSQIASLKATPPPDAPRDVPAKTAGTGTAWNE